MELYLIRHTKVKIDKGICYGQTDVDTAMSYPEELLRLKQLLPDDLSGFAAFTSPLKRCSSLASDLFGDTRREDPRVMEMNFGEWEMMKWSDIERGLMDQWAKDFVNYRCPGGESYHDLYVRSAEFLGELIDKRMPLAAVVTHAGVLHAFIADILSMDLKNSLKIHFDYGGVTQVHFGKSRTIINYMNRI